MDPYFRRDANRQRLRVDPLRAHLDTFAQMLSKHGYAIDTGQRQLEAVSSLSQWMDRRGMQANDLDEHALEQFLRARRRTGRFRNTDPQAMALLLAHLRQAGVVDRLPSSVEKDGLGQMQHDFEHYLHQERGPWRRSIPIRLQKQGGFVQMINFWRF